MHADLRAALDAWGGGSGCMLTTSFSKEFTEKGFRNFMADKIGAAGLPERCVTHGLRKAAARRLAEAGCSANEIASITGHETLKEVQRYTKAAEQRKLAVAAMARLPARPLTGFQTGLGLGKMPKIALNFRAWEDGFDSAPGHQYFLVISAHCWRAFWENRGINRAGDTTGDTFRPRGSASRFMPPPSTEQLLARSSCGSVATLIAPRSGRIPPDAAAPHALLIATTRASARGRATRTMMACTAVSECCVDGRIASRPFPGHHLLCPLPRVVGACTDPHQPKLQDSRAVTRAGPQICRLDASPSPISGKVIQVWRIRAF